MNIRNFFLLMTLSILMVSTKAMSDECVAGNNFFLPAEESYTLYSDLYQGYNDGLTVCVSQNYGASVRVEDGEGQELFILVEEDSDCVQYQGVDTVKATCEGVGSDDCNISWTICGESSGFLNPDPPTTRPTKIDDLANDEDDVDEFGFSVRYILTSDASEPRLVKDNSRIGSFKVEPCPEGTVLTPFEMPIYDKATGLFVVGFRTVYFCISEDTPIPE